MTRRFTIAGQPLVYISAPVASVERFAALTPAERSVAFLAASGATHAEIAKARGSSPRTVANQLARIYRKLGVGSRVELVALVESAG
jgi:DNA-binding CsgD family transcriptional regulator